MPYNIWCGGCGNHIGMGECMLHDNISDIYCLALNFCRRKTASKFKIMCVDSASMIPRGQFFALGASPEPCVLLGLLLHQNSLFIVAFHILGVRYNAEKKKVGNYYTTPIYRFRMKCHLCDNHFEIETDPKVSPLSSNIHTQILPTDLHIFLINYNNNVFIHLIQYNIYQSLHEILKRLIINLFNCQGTYSKNFL